jgi:Protein of unknown function (DUF2917)
MSQTQSQSESHSQPASHFTQALWTLLPGEALSLEIGPGPRELSVTEGRVWLTQTGRLDDVWLAQGQSVQLASGSRVVLEAWPSAKFQLLVPPAVCPAMVRRAKPVASGLAWAKPSVSGLAAA